MSKKIVLKIDTKNYDLNGDDDFYFFLKEQLNIDFNLDGNNEVKALLHGYVRQSYELFIQDQKIKTLLDKIGN